MKGTKYDKSDPFKRNGTRSDLEIETAVEGKRIVQERKHLRERIRDRPRQEGEKPM